jgi:uncharacterized OB-fold protein
MIELLRRTGADAARVEYRLGRPRDIDPPSLAAEVLGRLLAGSGVPPVAVAPRGAGVTLFADDLSDGLTRLWPMVEALAGRPVDVTFAPQPDGADYFVAAAVGPDSAWAQAARVDTDVTFDHEARVGLGDPTGVAPPEVGGLDMPAWWLREERDLLALRGRRCPGCGRVEFPAPPSRCPGCGAIVQPHVLATAGRILTWTVDQLYESRVATGMAVVDLAGGGRFYGQLADGVPVDTLAAGAVVRLVPRVLHADDRRSAYFWKVTDDEEATGA